MKTRTASIPCSLCARQLDQREDKNGKPYFVCDECGTQFFIRGATGKERLVEMVRKVKARRAKARIMLEKLDQVQGFIETFYEDELIFPKGDDGEEAVPFSEWSRQVCDEVSKALDGDFDSK